MTSPSGRYRSLTDLVRLPAAGAQLVYVPLSRDAALLDPNHMRALEACRAFATLDEHASHGIPRALLDDLVRAKLLVAEDDLIDAVRASAPDRENASKIASIGIPTRDRPALLERALASYSENARRHGRSARFIVADGGTSGPPKTNVTIEYSGVTERRAFIDALVAQGFERAPLELGLLPDDGPLSSTGANRNALLLHTAGELSLQVDDDTLAEIAAPPDVSSDLALTSLADPTELWFPSSAAEAADACVLDVHEELLGRSIGLLARSNTGVDVARTSGMFIRRLHPAARVLTTQLGSRGDSGTGTMFHLLAASGPSRARLHASERGYNTAFTTRDGVRVAARPTITDGPFCMSMCIGLDHRDVLPPFYPRQRNCDGVFGAVLRATRHDAYQGFLPRTIAHQPDPPRSSSIADLATSLRAPATGDIVCHLVNGSRVESDARDPAAGLRALGRTLARWASLPPADFHEIARINVLRAKAAEISLFSDLHRLHRGEPKAWAADIERAAEASRAAAIDPDLGIPGDLRVRCGDEAARKFQSLVSLYCRLLEIWPDVVSAAVELRSKKNISIAMVR